MMCRSDPPLTPWHVGDAGNDHGGPASACGGASTTTPDVAPVTAAAAAMPLPANAAPLALSHTPALERDPLFSILRAPQGGKPRVRQHRQRDVAMPTGPVAHFVVVQAGFALAFL